MVIIVLQLQQLSYVSYIYTILENIIIYNIYMTHFLNMRRTRRKSYIYPNMCCNNVFESSLLIVLEFQS